MSRTMSSAIALIALCVLSILSVAFGQGVGDTPTSCRPILGLVEASYPTIKTVPAGYMVVNEYAVQSFASYTEYVFTYQIPDQTTSSAYSTPNKLRFAIYTVSTAATGNSHNLVAQSEEVTIDAGSKGQVFVVPALFENGYSPATLQQNGKNSETNFFIAVWNQYAVGYYTSSKQPDGTNHGAYQTVDASKGFPTTWNLGTNAFKFDLPYAYEGCTTEVSTVAGDPVFVGYHGQKFQVDGMADRVYNVLSLASLQLNSRFIMITEGQAMNVTEQRSLYRRQKKLFEALRKASANSAALELPATTTWSHDGTYMDETGVQVNGHRVLVKPGAYVDGFQLVELDGVVLPVSDEIVALGDDATVAHPTRSVVRITSFQASFSLVNSDHFLNVASATLNHTTPAQVDGLLGQTASVAFTVKQSKSFKEHQEMDFMLPEGEDVWSTNFEHNRYINTANSS